MENGEAKLHKKKIKKKKRKRKGFFMKRNFFYSLEETEMEKYKFKVTHILFCNYIMLLHFLELLRSCNKFIINYIDHDKFHLLDNNLPIYLSSYFILFYLILFYFEFFLKKIKLEIFFDTKTISITVLLSLTLSS